MFSRKRLLLALALSGALHVMAVVAPGWRLPWFGDTEPAAMLEARLVTATPRAPTGFSPRTAPRRKSAAAKSPPPAAEEPSATAPETPPAEAAQTASTAPDASGVAPAVDTDASGAVAEAPPANASESVPVPSASSAAATAEISLPRQGRIEYAISRGERGFVVGRSVHEWQHDDTAYNLRSVNETTGLIALFRSVRAVLTSNGAIAATGLVPRDYRADRGSGVDEAHFDWTAGKVQLSSGEKREAALASGAQDLLSMFYQLGILLRNGGIRDIAIATGRKFETYSFDIVGEEALPLRFGVQRTLHVKTRSTPGSDSTEIWLGLDLSGLPLQIRHADRDGEVFYQTADRLELGGEAVGLPVANAGH